MKPTADFALTPEECHQFCNFIKSIKFPNGFVSNLTKNITDDDNKFAGLKLHFHVIMQHLLLLGFRYFLKKPIVTTITELCTFFKLCA